MFHIWYPKLQDSKKTYKSKIIPVSNLFIETYLKADGLSQPEAHDISNLSVEEQTEYLREVGAIREQIRAALVDEYKKGCLVKMNWSSTIDAEFMCATLNCFTADEVFMQLKASNTISEDLVKPFDTDKVNLD